MIDLHAGSVADALRAAGCEDVEVRPVGCRMWFGSPLTGVSLVCARRHGGRDG